MTERPVGFSFCAAAIDGTQTNARSSRIRIVISDLFDGIVLIRGKQHVQSFDLFAGLYLHALKFLIVVLKVVFADGYCEFLELAGGNSSHEVLSRPATDDEVAARV